MTSTLELIKWLAEAGEGAQVGIDDGGLCLRIVREGKRTDTDPWFEIGGLEEEEEDEDESDADEPQCSLYPIEDWHYAVRNRDTLLGYREWVKHQKEAAGSTGPESSSETTDLIMRELSNASPADLQRAGKAAAAWTRLRIAEDVLSIPPGKEKAYEVIVGNIGTVYKGGDKQVAIATFEEYKRQSADGYGRAAGEPVSLLFEEEVIDEFDQTV